LNFRFELPKIDGQNVILVKTASSKIFRPKWKRNTRIDPWPSYGFLPGRGSSWPRRGSRAARWSCRWGRTPGGASSVLTGSADATWSACTPAKKKIRFKNGPHYITLHYITSILMISILGSMYVMVTIFADFDQFSA
jgi:hypothetical protein